MILSSQMRRPQQAINHQLISPYHNSESLLSYVSPLPALSSSSSGYNFSNSNSYCNSSSGTPASSFSGYYEAISSIPSTAIMNSTTSSSNASNTIFLQTPDSHFSNNGFLMFGREASCSSSDGSYNNNNSNNQNSNIKGMEFDYGKFNGSEYMGFPGYSDTARVDGNQKMMMASNSGDVVNGFSEKADGFYSENPLDYSLEEVRQLINSNFSDNLNFFVDESKTAEEKVMYN